MNITAQELKERIDKVDRFLLIDVRDPHDYSSHNLGGLLIPLRKLSGRIHEIEEWKNEEVVVLCRKGPRSEEAQKYLVSEGFTNVKYVKGGLEEYNQL
jgi:rhodanese-related sulfurtransferase